MRDIHVYVQRVENEIMKLSSDDALERFVWELTKLNSPFRLP